MTDYHSRESWYLAARTSRHRENLR